MTRRRSFIACLLGALLAGCHQAPSSPDVVARSRLGEIRKADLDAYVLTQPENRRGPAAGQDIRAWRRSVVEELLLSRGLEAEGQRDRVLEDPKAAAWLSAETDSLLMGVIKDRRLAALAEPTEAQVRAYYDSHPDEVSHAGQIRLRHIFRRVARDAPREAREAARRDMQDLLRQIRAGASFEEMARTRSDSETAPQGGLIGRLKHGDLAPSVERIVWKLGEGQVSEVVGTAVGFHIFRLDNHIPPFKMDFAEALPRLRKRLALEASDRTLQEQVAELVTASGATYRPEAATGSDPEAVLFSLGSFRLTRADWEKELASRSFASQREAPPQDLLGAFVGDKLRLWEARRLKLEQEPAVAARLAELRRGATLRLAREKRLKALLGGQAQALQAFYEANKARYMTPKLYHLRLITVRFPPSGVDYTVFERLQALAAEIRGGKRSFADAAREVSSDLSASRGGDLGLVRLDALGEWAGPRAYAHIEKLAVGEVSEPILVERYSRRTLTYDRDGYMLLLLEEVREPAVRPYAEVQDEVAEELVGRDSATFGERLRKDVLASIQARIYDQNL